MSQGFSIGVVGDFSAAGGLPGGERRFLEIDRDELGAVFQQLSPRVKTGLPFCPEIELDAWEQLHPDELAARVPALSKLLDARDEVGSPRLMRRLIEDSGVDVGAVSEAAQAPVETNGARAPVARMSEGDLLDAIMDGGPSESPVQVVSPSADPDFDRVIAEIAEASADRTDYALQDRWREAIDREIAARMRAILHCAAFRQLEASWRSLRGLVVVAETGEELRIRVLDLSRGDLAADLAEGARSPILDRLVVEAAGGTPGGEPFGLLVADYALGPGEDDRALLVALADVAGRARVPCVAGLCPDLLPDGDLDWTGLESLRGGLRAVAGAERLGLVGPRLLLRLPYGPDTEPIDRFELDEEPADGREQLWGNGAYAVAFAAAEARASLGRVAAVAKFAQLENLPVYVSRRGVDVESVGPTDRLVSDSEIERLSDLGLIPLVGFRGRDTAFVARFQSLTGAALFPA